MAELKLAGLLADLVHREIDDPAEFVALLIHVAGHCRSEHLAHDAGRFLRLALPARRHADKAAGLEAESLGELSLLVLKEFRNTAGKLTVFVGLEPVGLHAGLHLNVSTELVDLLAGKLTVRDNDGLYGVSLGKGCKIGAGDERSYIFNHEIYAQIGLIRAVFLHRFVISYAAEGRLVGYVVGSELFEYRGQNVLYDGENILLAGKGHLHIELIELARGAVAACVLVAEAGRYLEIAVKA